MKGPAALDREAAATAEALRERAVTWFFISQFVVLIYFEKFCIPVGGASVSVVPLALYAGLGAMAVFSKIEISPPRLALFAAFFVAALASQLMVAGPFSSASFVYLIAQYLPLVFIWRLSWNRYQGLLKVFQNLMLLPALMVFVQLASQLVFGMGHLPSIERLFPERLMMPGYLYDHPIRWDMTFVRPNGFFFLEPSYIATFLACALIIELTFLHRLWRIAFYGAALMGTMGATGFLIVALAAPFVIPRQSPRILVLCAVMGVVLLVGAVASGALDFLISRLGEFGNSRSSAWQRIVQPLRQLSDAMADSSHLITGAGAGNVSEIDSSPWPVTKLAAEYGLTTGLLFLLMISVSMVRCPIRGLMWALYVVFNFTGGYLLTPAMPGLVLVMIAMLVPDPPAPAEVELARTPDRDPLQGLPPAFAGPEAAGRSVIAGLLSKTRA